MAVNNRKHIGQQLWPHREHKHHHNKYQPNWPTNWSTALLVVFSILYLSCLLQFTSAHVALTYPPARKYDLDFLDNSRTKGPCGMPKVVDNQVVMHNLPVASIPRTTSLLLGHEVIWWKISNNKTAKPKHLSKDRFVHLYYQGPSLMSPGIWRIPTK
ncbi:hypothetical protein CVS40_9485 [Lucilia cuprina]|nr:hypothetical protein CVS40_9485 [Lucilia cuprina]